MKKNIKFELNGNKYSVDVERQGDVLLLNNEGKEIRVTLLEGEKKAVKPRAQAPAPASAQAAPAPSGAKAAPAAQAGTGDVVAPMTGTIKEIRVAKGDQVQADQLIVVMEAMKMDIEVFAHSAGAVQDIYLAPGSSVSENQPILKLA